MLAGRRKLAVFDRIVDGGSFQFGINTSGVLMTIKLYGSEMFSNYQIKLIKLTIYRIFLCQTSFPSRIVGYKSKKPN